MESKNSPLNVSTFALREGMANSTGTTENSIDVPSKSVGPALGLVKSCLMNNIKGLWSKYAKYGKYAILAGLVGDFVVLGGG
jgi:hypothetical protein